MAQRTRVVLATGNAGKVRELSEAIAALGFAVRAQSEFALAPAAETAPTFVENALLKARHAARHTGLPAIADDAGLACAALGGAPGIHSARYAGSGASDADNVARLLAAMAPVPEPQRDCRFICVLVYLAHAEDPTPVICEGIWHGRLALSARGTHGFGYDPVFWVPERGCTAAELEPAVKASLSHRGQALRLLAARLAERT